MNKKKSLYDNLIDIDFDDSILVCPGIDDIIKNSDEQDIIKFIHNFATLKLIVHVFNDMTNKLIDDYNKK